MTQACALVCKTSGFYSREGVYMLLVCMFMFIILIFMCMSITFIFYHNPFSSSCVSSAFVLLSFLFSYWLHLRFLSSSLAMPLYPYLRLAQRECVLEEALSLVLGFVFLSLCLYSYLCLAQRECVLEEAPSLVLGFVLTAAWRLAAGQGNKFNACN